MKEDRQETDPVLADGKKKTKKAGAFAVFIVCSAAVIFLTVACLARFETGFIAEHASVISSVAVGIELIYIGAALFFLLRGSEIASKLFLSGEVIAAGLLSVLFLLQVTGLFDKIDSVEELRRLIGSTGVWAPLIYIAVQFLQVVILPLPGTLTVGAGVLLFGPLKASLFSLAGIFLGSLAAFAVGRRLGYKAAAWLVGKESLDTWLQKVKGKDKVVLGAMFLLPIFPDDILCFVAGLSTMSLRFFIVLQLITRSASVFMTSYSLNGSLIPFDTWWGIAIWCLLAAAVIAVFILLFKKGDKIEAWLMKKWRKLCKKKAGEDGVLCVRPHERDDRGQE